MNLKKVLMISVSIFVTLYSNAIWAVTPTISTGLYHTIVLKDDGSVLAWGDNSAGQIGDNTEIPTRYSPFDINFKASAISAGSASNIALKEDGSVWAWGLNNTGQMGNGTKSDNHYNIPEKISALDGKNIIAINTDGQESFAIEDTGSGNVVWAWGWNYYGQLGNGEKSVNPVLSPIQLDITNVIAINAYPTMTAFLKDDGTVWYCGSMGKQITTPTQIVEFSNVATITIGMGTVPNDDAVNDYPSVYGLLNDGTVWYYSTENGIFQQLTIGGIAEITDIKAGIEHLILLTEDGTVWATGRSTYGQMGYGSLSSTWTTTQVYDGENPITGITAISANYENSSFIKDGDTVWNCGRNIYDQIGYGIDIDDDAAWPYQVVGESGVGSHMHLKTAGITVSAINGDTAETGTQATFTAVLDREPEEEVVLYIESTDTDEGTVSPNYITFSSDWDTPQTITVTGVNDSISDGDQDYTIQLSIDGTTTDNSGYKALITITVNVVNINNDTEDTQIKEDTSTPETSVAASDGGSSGGGGCFINTLF